jgi:formiminotetrahydrofolate cyclodeaminase
LAQTITAVGNLNAVTDAAAGGLMAHAAVQIAALNVKINAKGLQNRELAERMTREVDELESEVAELAARIATTAAERGEF